MIAGLSQEALGAPDLSKSFISLLENGRSFPSLETVLTLSRRLEHPLTALLLDGAERRREVALSLLQAAGDMDMASRGADAVRLVDAARALTPDLAPVHQAQVMFVHAYAATMAGEVARAGELADRLESFAREHALQRWLASALWVKGETAFRRRTFEAARTYLLGAVAVFERVRATRTVEFVRTALSLGAVHYYTDRFEQARHWYRRASVPARKLTLHGLYGRALTGLGLAAAHLRQFDDALAYFNQAHDVFALTEDRVEMSRVLNNLGVVHRERDQLEAALQVLQRALRIREQLPIPSSRSLTLDEIALTYLAMGRHADAIEAARRAIGEAQLGQDRAFEAAAQVTLARVLLAQGNARDAIEFMKAAVSTFTIVGARRRAAAVAVELAKLLREHGNAQEAPRYLAMARGGADARARTAPSPR
jgi:tetratricopeptide (TPR) repeat protein